MTVPYRKVPDMISIYSPALICLNNPLHFGVQASEEPVHFP